MLGVFEFIISIIFLFLLVVYVIYLDIKSDAKTDTKTTTDTKTDAKTDTKTTTDTKTDAKTDTKTDTKTTTDAKTDYTDTCKRKCTKATKVDGTCYHPIKYNPLLKKNQEIKSQLICPWQCSSGYSDDPNTCRYNSDCIGCSPTVSFPNIDKLCPNSTYGCCGDKKTEKTDEFGNNCLGVTGCTGSTGATGSCFEGFNGLEGMVSESEPVKDDLKNDSNKYNQSIPNKTIYPTCPNIQCPNESAFQKDDAIKKDVSLGTLPPYPWPVVTDYTTFGV